MDAACQSTRRSGQIVRFVIKPSLLNSPKGRTVFQPAGRLRAKLWLCQLHRHSRVKSYCSWNINNIFIYNIHIWHTSINISYGQSVYDKFIFCRYGHAFLSEIMMSEGFQRCLETLVCKTYLCSIVLYIFQCGG